MIEGVGFVDFSVLVELVKESRISTVVVRVPLVSDAGQSGRFIEGVGQFLPQDLGRYQGIWIQAGTIVFGGGGIVVDGLWIRASPLGLSQGREN